MPDLANLNLGRRARRLRVDTLIRLRWLAVAGQSAAVLATFYGLGFPLPLGLCFLAIAASAWLNIGLRVRFPVSHRLEDTAALILLSYDVLQLSGLLYLTGGLENPFAMLFLAPVMIAAVSLTSRATLLLGILIVLAASFLAFFHLPLPWLPNESLSLPILYLAGIWLAIVLGAAFIGIYAARVAEEARRLSDALAATELVLAREQHLTQLDGLAAAAAHELGTPLATITLIVKDLAEMLPIEGLIGEDVVLLAQEVQRCRMILGKLASLGDEGAEMLDRMTVSHLVEEVVEPQRNFGVELVIDNAGEGAEPICRRNPGILYGLGNLVENAMDFANSRVRIEMRWTQDQVRITIEDDGPGFLPDVLIRVGEPYISTKGPERRAKSENGGLGLGLFIAKTLLERSGATVAMANAPPPGRGARIVVIWPRLLFERLKTGEAERSARGR
ncbi:MAG: two-component sensor histidine kinase [Hyphomicrobiales bacterium]|nr:two-component sensor histidine kinase [Hyphomicrobiales bacterium]